MLIYKKIFNLIQIKINKYNKLKISLINFIKIFIYKMQINKFNKNNKLLSYLKCNHFYTNKI